MRAAIKKQIRSVFKLAGVEIARYPPRNTLAWELKRLVHQRHITKVLDVGAHEGGFVRLLRNDVGYQGRIVSFEPNPETFATLKRERSNDPAWSGCNFGLGEKTSKLTFNRYARSTFDSFLEPNATGRDRFPEKMTHLATVEVPIERLEDVVSIDGPTMLKVDTQGYDLRVLRGASGLLSDVDVVVAELPVRPIYDGAPVLTDIVSYLWERGYRPTGMFPISYDQNSVGVIEFDGVFAR